MGAIRNVVGKILLTKTYRRDLALKMNDIKARISREFPNEKYGFYETLKNCDRIRIFPFKEGPEFVLETSSRKISTDNPNGDDYDCAEASAIVLIWLKDQNISAKIKSAIVNDLCQHYFIKARGYDVYIGASPLDKYFTKDVPIRQLRTVRYLAATESINLSRTQIPICNNIPACWIDLGNDMSAMLHFGMNYFGYKGVESRLRPCQNAMNINFSVTLLNRIDIIDTYRFHIFLPRDNLFILKKLSKFIKEAKIEEGRIIENFKDPSHFNYLFKDPKCLQSYIFAEDHGIKYHLTQNIKNKYGNIILYMLDKLDSKDVEELNRSPYYVGKNE